MAAAGDLIPKMTIFSTKFIVVLVLIQLIYAVNGDELSESFLRRAKRAGTPKPYEPTASPDNSTSTQASATTTLAPKPSTKSGAAPAAPAGSSTAAPTSTPANKVPTDAPSATTAADNGNTTPVPTAAPTQNGSTTTAAPPSAAPTVPGTGTTTPKPASSTPLPVITSTKPQASSSAPVTTPKVSTTPAPTTTLQPHQSDKDYYILSIPPDSFAKYWVDIEHNARISNTFKVEQYKVLNRRQAMNISLPWDFLYYGHTVRNVTLASGGFINMNPFIHTSLTLTQNMSPLMSHLTRSSNDTAISGIFQANNATMMIFEWRGMLQYDSKHDEGIGNLTFTFQVQMLTSGEIRFVYKDVPIAVSNISTGNHDVKAGISDGFWDKDHRLIEYHMIDVSDNVTDQTVIIFSPKPTCIQQETCDSCAGKVPGFSCIWCEEVKRCSDGMDRYRADWFNRKCPTKGTTTCATTPVPPTQKPSSTVSPVPVKPKTSQRPKPTTKAPCVKDKNGKCTHPKPAPTGANVGAIVGIMVLIFVILGAGGWFWYAYKYPTTASGMCLMSAKTSCCKKGRVSRSSKDYQAFMESDTESLPL